MSHALNPKKKKHRFTKAWMHEHVTDHWVTEAQRRGYRSRAAFKLLELADKDALLERAMTVVDLGAAPGSWSQVLRERLGPGATIIAVDVLDIEPIAGVRPVKADFRTDEGLAALETALAGRRADLVVSDMAPNLSGVASADQARAIHLADLALEFASKWLQPGGDLVVKLFQGEGFAEFRASMQKHFAKVHVRKPAASRDRSREVFLVGKGLSERRDER